MQRPNWESKQRLTTLLSTIQRSNQLQTLPFFDKKQNSQTVEGSFVGGVSKNNLPHCQTDNYE